MSNIFEAFKNKKALIPFIVAGDPSLAVTEKLVSDFEKAGADIIELGVPFSDPLADGPVIQAAHQRALKNDISLKDVFALVKKLRKTTSIPIVFMLAENLIEKYGPRKFYADCAMIGVDGVIVPDMPAEEWSIAKGERKKVDEIFLAAPTSEDERIKCIASASSGFIYLVSTTGITGKRAKLSGAIAGMVAKIRKYSQKPVAVGFGISSPAQAKEAVKYADGVIVGSAIVDLVAKRNYKKAVSLVASLKRAINV
ncbi:MAG TPA: tryptophan synthase subunit alpha [Candidatus Omnitrophota bacterium]|nr:tryptophan synthase subunit alpha [Candidatus Omnitrophota bacterium]